LYFSLLIYTVRGECIQHFFQKASVEHYVRNIKLLYDFTDLWFASGEYTITFAVYDSFDVMDNSREQPAMIKMDRSVSFLIENRIDRAINQALITTQKKPRIAFDGEDVTDLVLSI